MKKFLIATTLSLLMSALSFADIYGPGPGGPVPDSGGGPFVSPILISNTAQPTIVSVNAVSLVFSTPHTWVGDLTITLTAPNGDDVHLIRRVGATTATSVGDSSDFGGPFTFVNVGGGDITAAALGTTGPVPPGVYDRTSTSAQATPSFDPDDYTVFDLDDINGTWTLTIEDFAGGDVGTLGSWTLDITSVPEPSSMALAGLASLVGLVLVRRRKK